MDDKKDISKGHLSPIENSKYKLINQSNRAFFVSFHKTTEKIVAALFLVTEILSDNNPIRLKIRTLGVDLMSFMLSSPAVMTDSGQFFSVHYSTRLLEVLSLLEVSFLSEQISEMNFLIISREISRMISVSDGMQKQSESASLFSRSARILARDKTSKKTIDALLSASSKLGSQIMTRDTHKRHSIGHKRNGTSYRKEGEGPRSMEFSAPKRRDLILGLLKDAKHLTIKDFMSVIVGVSDKTIQRDLVSMVRDGVLKKEGERRWSRYYVPIPGIVTPGPF